MRYLILSLAMSALVLLSFSAQAARNYGARLCKSPDFYCIKVRRGQSWASLFPNSEERDIVKRVNRMNTGIWGGMTIAVPKNLGRLTVYDVSPFPRYIEPPGEKTLYFSQKELAWGAYDKEGELIWWGPISPGKDWCSDINESCQTPAGAFRIIRKQDIDCISTAFPKRPWGENGGAPMPFCMHFYRGFALHGAHTVPGHRASHGCIRLFIEDARWLNKEFIDLPGTGKKGTRVIIGPV